MVNQIKGAPAGKRKSGTAGSHASALTAAPKKKTRNTNKKSVASTLTCRLCDCSANRDRWAETRIDADGAPVPVKDLCWDCGGEFKSREGDFESFDHFVEWGLSEEGQQVLQKATRNGQQSGRKSDDTLASQVVCGVQAHGVRICRDMWIAYLLEFKQFFSRDPNQKMPRLHKILVPQEQGNGTEYVYCFAVGSKVYPLRKMQVYTDLGTTKTRMELSAEESQKSKSKAHHAWLRSLQNQQTEWEQSSLYGQAQILTIDEFCSRWGEVVPDTVDTSSQVDLF